MALCPGVLIHPGLTEFVLAVKVRWAHVGESCFCPEDPAGYQEAGRAV